MRLDKLLSNLKYGSRKEIKQIIKSKRIKVNGEVVKDSSIHVDPNHDLIEIDQEVIHYKEHVYLMLNKPSGVISSTEDGMHKTVIDLLNPEEQVYDVFPCGRLDIDTEGLMILSNDGQFAHKLLHPKKEIYKTYYVEVIGEVSEEDRKLFYNGMEILDGQGKAYQTKRAYLDIIESNQNSKASVAICEGKFHQVKRMFQHCGKQVTYLKRTSMGQLQLDESLALGEYRELLKEELELLFLNKEIYKEE